MTTATKTPAIGETICWKMISGLDADARLIYGDHGVGEVIGFEHTPIVEREGENLILVRRTSYPFGTVLVRPGDVAA
jgi:hypothetical protein